MQLAAAMVVAGNVSLVVPGIDDVWIIRSHGNIATFTASDLVQIRLRYGRTRRSAGHTDRRIILLGAVDTVRHLAIGRDMVKFRRGLVKYAGPALSAVEGHTSSPVIPLDHAPGIGRVNPEVVVIPVGKGHVEKRTAAINRFPGLDIKYPEGFCVLRVGIDMLVVPRTLPQIAFLAESLPALASVV